MRRTLTFTKGERARLADQCKALGITFEEFVHQATMQACDEMEGGVWVAPNTPIARLRREIERCAENVRPEALEDYKTGLQMALLIMEGKA